MSGPLHQASVAPASAPAQFLTFILDGGTYGMDILCVKEIIEHGQLTPVPMMPPDVCGVINLRGAVVPVIDLKARFGRPSGGFTKRTCIVIGELGGAHPQTVGAVVDAVNEVLDIAPQDIEPAPHFGASTRRRYVKGMAKLRGNFVILLNASEALALDDFTVGDLTGDDFDGQETVSQKSAAPLPLTA